jgi:hypothetical protein
MSVDLKTYPVFYRDAVDVSLSLKPSRGAGHLGNAPPSKCVQVLKALRAREGYKKKRKNGFLRIL